MLGMDAQMVSGLSKLDVIAISKIISIIYAALFIVSLVFGITDVSNISVWVIMTVKNIGKLVSCSSI